MNKKALVSGSIVLAIVFIACAFVYWGNPAGSLPHFFPGYMAGSSVVHIKHGIGMFILALVLIAYAWLSTGKKPSN
jgi:hypothetical protein